MNLTVELVQTSTASEKDKQAALAWLALAPGERRRCRAAERIAKLREAPEAIKEDRPGGSPAPAPESMPELTPEAALRAIRRIHDDWKGRPHVCGNAFRRMHEVEEMLRMAGF
jgi:hypothetical protein